MVKLNKLLAYLAVFIGINTIALIYSKLSGFSLGLSFSIGLWALLAIVLSINNFIDAKIFQDFKSSLHQGLFALYSALVFCIFVEDFRLDPLIDILGISTILILVLNYSNYKSIVDRFIFGFSIGTNLTLYFTTPSTKFLIVCIIFGILATLTPMNYPHLYIITLNYWNSIVLIYSIITISNQFTNPNNYLFTDYRIAAIIAQVLTLLGSSYQLKSIGNDEPLLPNQFTYQTFVNSSQN